jgi:hypothetical protein
MQRDSGRRTQATAVVPALDPSHVIAPRHHLLARLVQHVPLEPELQAGAALRTAVPAVQPLPQHPQRHPPRSPGTINTEAARHLVLLLFLLALLQLGLPTLPLLLEPIIESRWVSKALALAGKPRPRRLNS